MSDEKKVLEIVVKTIGDADIKALAKELANVRKEAQASRKSLAEAERGIRDLGQQASQSRKQLGDIHESLGTFATTLKRVGGLIGVGFTIKGLISSSALVKELNDHVREVGASFIDATFAASGFTETLNDPSMWQQIKDGAVGVGNAIGFVFKQAKAGYDFLHDPTGVQRRAEQQVRDATPIEIEPVKYLEQDFAAIADSTMAIKINIDDTAKTMAEIAEQRRKWAEFDREMRANSREALAAESKAAALDARRHTAQFAYDPGQFKSDMDAASISVDLVSGSMATIEADLAGIVENSSSFKDTWDELASNAYSWDDALQIAIDELKTINDLQGSMVNQARAWADILTYSFTAVLEGQLHNTRDLLHSITIQMRNFYAEMAARAAAQQVLGMVQGLMGLASMAGSAGSFTSLMQPQAKGNAFSGGNVVPFARGGVISSPTVFPMAHGMGLMGERGPEAVMPLKRDASGRLGVSASAPSVTINNQTGVAATAEVSNSNDRLEITLRAAQMGASMAVSEVNRSIRSGYGSTATSLARSFGLRRRM